MLLQGQAMWPAFFFNIGGYFGISIRSVDVLFWSVGARPRDKNFWNVEQRVTLQVNFHQLFGDIKILRENFEGDALCCNRRGSRIKKIAGNNI